MSWAIDFETANADRASACALGLVVVQGSQIVERRSWLIRPSKGSFDLNNIMLHGITADRVTEMPTFAELWDEVHSAIRDMHLVAHNASFDIGVLRHTLDAYKIPYAKLDYYCTRDLADYQATAWSLFRTIWAYRSRTIPSKGTQWPAPPSCFAAVVRLALTTSPSLPSASS